MLTSKAKNIIKAMFVFVALGVSTVSFSEIVEQQTWVEIKNTVYGAKPDSSGPIGGGDGYKRVVKNGDYAVKDLESLLEALSKADSGQVVFIPGETEIDLTTRVKVSRMILEVPSGVTLAGDRGYQGSRGALLYSSAPNTRAMIQIKGPNARVSGLRIKGPNPERCQEHYDSAFGLGGLGRSYYYKVPTQDGIQTRFPGLEVDNCEVSGFSHAGIFLSGGEGHHIHHNYIHHCQYQGLGYGVCLDTASSIIEFNLFDWNRHSISGTGRPGCGYTARNNVVLGASLSHCFDMHGGKDRKDGTDIAGTFIEICNNTFWVDSALPVKIRGVPVVKCDVYRNWFQAYDAPRKAVRAPQLRTRVFDNAFKTGLF